MRDKFKTIEEARAHRYRRWSGNPDGTPYREGYCAESVADGGRSVLFGQCGRKVSSVALYCAQHKPGADEAREAKAGARYKRELAMSDVRALNTAASLLRKAGENDAADKCEALAKRVMGDHQ